MNINFTLVQSICRASARRGRYFCRRALDYILPPHCPVTDLRVAHQGEMSGKGWFEISHISEPFCQGCGIPFQVTPLGVAGPLLLCALCLHPSQEQNGLIHPRGVDRARAALLYNDTTAPLILKLKYADRHDLARPLSRLMVMAGKQILDNPEAIVTPVPQHKARLRARRYNQAALLGQCITRQSGHDYVPDLLVRHKKTPPQKGLSSGARARNVSAAFRFKTIYLDRVKGATIVLIDDVLTTGATVQACAQVLKRAGVARVDVLTVARVIGRPSGSI